MRAGFEWVDLPLFLKAGDRVFIKPNLTFPSYRKGVMTSPDALRALVEILKDYTHRITICESDSGGYNRFSMDQVFRETGIKAMAEYFGVGILNTSFSRPKEIRVRTTFKTLTVSLPSAILDECHLFITMPVPKIHMNTRVSLSLKNQWGLIQDPSERLKMHPYFKDIIYEINKALPKSMAIIDGKYGLNRSGPMKGDPVELDWLMVSDNLFAADFVCCHLIGIDPFQVPHIKYALRKEGIRRFSDINLNCDYKQFIASEGFYLKREWTDYPGLLAFNSRLLAYIGYHSPLARPLHNLLYKFREPFYDYGTK
ncbi:MAG TPA: DUF362 domain-containing protein [Nitrososphaera sp.]|nr:DUF362 domain-containing protein [Nitrososphaera sp.]